MPGHLPDAASTGARRKLKAPGGDFQSPLSVFPGTEGTQSTGVIIISSEEGQPR
jgi:hypothetical protein